MRSGKEKVLVFLLQCGGVQSVAAVIAIVELGQCFKFVTGERVLDRVRNCDGENSKYMVKKYMEKRMI